MKKFIVIAILLSLAGCQFTVGQAILTSVGSTNTSKVNGGSLMSTNSSSPTPSASPSPSPTPSPKGATNLWKNKRRDSFILSLTNLWNGSTRESKYYFNQLRKEYYVNTKICH